TFATLARLHKLRALGVQIAMDDFGTGYSSLSYLRSFPFDKIKIDRPFIQDLSNGAEPLAIVHAVVGLATCLNMVSTAEGVETRQQMETLPTAGCTEMQGYFLQPGAARERNRPADGRSGVDSCRPPAALDQGPRRRPPLRAMNASRSNRCTSCSFLISAPCSGGISFLGSRSRRVSMLMSSTMRSLSQSSSSEVEGFFFMPGSSRIS